MDVTLGSGRELPRGPAHRVLQPLRLALALPSIQQKLFLESLLSQSASYLSDPGWRKSGREEQSIHIPGPGSGRNHLLVCVSHMQRAGTTCGIPSLNRQSGHGEDGGSPPPGCQVKSQLKIAAGGLQLPLLSPRMPMAGFPHLQRLLPAFVRMGGRGAVSPLEWDRLDHLFCCWWGRNLALLCQAHRVILHHHQFSSDSNNPFLQA